MEELFLQIIKFRKKIKSLRNHGQLSYSISKMIGLNSNLVQFKQIFC